MSPHGNRTRLGGMLLAVVAALALLALPGLASSHGHHDAAADAGTIQSFDPESGVLTIDLTNGGSVSGLVVSRTHIRCGDDRGRHRGRHGLRHPRRDGGATISHRGGGEDEVEIEDEDEDHSGRGSGNSGRDDEPGEDAPGHDGTAPGRSEDPGQGAEHSDRCTAEDLVAGAPVKVADLVLIDGSAFYKHVVLHEQAPAGAPAP